MHSDTSISCNTTNVSICPSQDPALWNINSDIIDYFIRNPVISNPEVINFDNIIHKCGEFNRKLPHDIFKRKLLNSETKDRQWLLYSTSKNAPFFFFTAFYFQIKKHSLVPLILDLLIGKKVLKKLNNTKKM